MPEPTLTINEPTDFSTGLPTINQQDNPMTQELDQSDRLQHPEELSSNVKTPADFFGDILSPEMLPSALEHFTTVQDQYEENKKRLGLRLNDAYGGQDANEMLPHPRPMDAIVARNKLEQAQRQQPCVNCPDPAAPLMTHPMLG